MIESAVESFGPFLLRQEAVRERIRNTIEEVEINYVNGRWPKIMGAAAVDGGRAP